MVDRQHACEADDECHDRKPDDRRHDGTVGDVGRLADDGRRSSHDVCGRETLRAKSGADDQAGLQVDDVSVEDEFFETPEQSSAEQWPLTGRNYEPVDGEPEGFEAGLESPDGFDGGFDDDLGSPDGFDDDSEDEPPEEESLEEEPPEGEPPDDPELFDAVALAAARASVR